MFVMLYFGTEHIYFHGSLERFPSTSLRNGQFLTSTPPKLFGELAFAKIVNRIPSFRATCRIPADG